MLTVSGLFKSFGEKQALAGLSFEVHSGEVLAVVGPSGCGKSTLLNIIAGLETADQGEIAWEGKSINSMPPYQRGFGLMFQDFALFPHKNVFENVAFGLRMQHQPVGQIERQVEQILELVGLPGAEKRDVNTLSGGEQQRVALGRALAPQPRLLMLDEPLGSLDRRLRERLVLELRDILRRTRQTAIYVTHDQEEAFSLADRLAIMNSGKIEQIGAPAVIFYNPLNVFVARFLGLNNLLPGNVLRSDGDILLVSTPIGLFELPASDEYPPGSDVMILLRPDALQAAGGQQIQGIVKEVVFRGDNLRVTIDVQGVPLIFDLPSRTRLPDAGKPLMLHFDSSRALQIINK